MPGKDSLDEYLANTEKEFDALLKSLDEVTIDFNDLVFDPLILELPDFSDIPDLFDIPELTRIKTEPKKSRTKRKRKTTGNKGKKYPEFIQPLKKR